MTEIQVRVELSDNDFKAGAELATWMSEQSLGRVQYDDRSSEAGFLPIPVIVGIIVGIPVVVGTVAKVVDWIRKRNSCLVIIDARTVNAEPRISERCDIRSRRGDLIVLANEREQIHISHTVGPIDVEAIVQTVASGVIDSIGGLASSVGGTVEPIGAESTLHT